jgi:DNA-nicking Smr family endonuclease
MSRPTRDDERELFRRSIARGLPIRIGSMTGATPRAPAAPGGGLDGNTEDRLRRGLIAPDGRLDLHGMTEASAYRALHAYLGRAHKDGRRLVLVITGKGNPKRDDAPWMQSPHGVLKQMVPRWLKERPLAVLIAAVGPAHRRHGGEGALYVYLRKAR